MPDGTFATHPQVLGQRTLGHGDDRGVCVGGGQGESPWHDQVVAFGQDRVASQHRRARHQVGPTQDRCVTRRHKFLRNEMLGMGAQKGKKLLPVIPAQPLPDAHRWPGPAPRGPNHQAIQVGHHMRQRRGLATPESRRTVETQVFTQEDPRDPRQKWEKCGRLQQSTAEGIGHRHLTSSNGHPSTTQPGSPPQACPAPRSGKPWHQQIRTPSPACW